VTWPYQDAHMYTNVFILLVVPSAYYEKYVIMYTSIQQKTEYVKNKFDNKILKKAAAFCGSRQDVPGAGFNCPKKLPKFTK
jgi:hypothetical protein